MLSLRFLQFTNAFGKRALLSLPGPISGNPAGAKANRLGNSPGFQRAEHAEFLARLLHGEMCGGDPDPQDRYNQRVAPSA
jgi:hypothetical protein